MIGISRLGAAHPTAHRPSRVLQAPVRDEGLVFGTVHHITHYPKTTPLHHCTVLHLMQLECWTLMTCVIYAVAASIQRSHKGKEEGRTNCTGTHSIVHSAQLVKESTLEKVSKFATFCVKRCTKMWACWSFCSPVQPLLSASHSTDGDFDAPSRPLLLNSSLVDVDAFFWSNKIQAMFTALI